ncbi:pirin [Streptomyces thermolilacinus SPC6]|uniref:Pirin n=2 Tax=Streptomyces thermolilacinus TaxID=285540 RepID=A0A1D3DVR4_9ACTN|nr:pirin family protein [Streptomyces thermolilacinus]OEJ96422.1 pirin [Streptomyces thermolilacinus SPC6]
MSIHRAGDRYRGGDPDAGIETRHAFSFGPHYDPDNLRFGALIACNEERLAPGAGFDEHPHSHTEIVTWVVEGELTHRDSAGHATLVRPGDVQHLCSAGGVRHVERNDGAEPLVFVQMWLAPLEPGGEPSYEIVRGLADGAPASYAVPAAGAVLHVRRPDAGERTAVPDGDLVYVHVVRGDVRLAVGGEAAGTPRSGDAEAPGPPRAGSADLSPAAGVDLSPGDAARVTDPRDVHLTALTPAEVLLWHMAHPGRR